ncbi:hypothetical protein COLO4_10525 [Corchorus olitorius]|uniref:Uncharacterized protein n=1 Tax=Corchorus olitorius TaxID=93759 RepID=A0A1R3K8B1_9ROSI|nr:hypothetical protein COLO4_10525 [Corchorus olitorius]
MGGIQGQVAKKTGDGLFRVTILILLHFHFPING